MGYRTGPEFPQLPNLVPKKINSFHHLKTEIDMADTIRRAVVNPSP
jgi:hypothetical protein